MKIALIGYGKMGKEIEKVALERNHTVVRKFSEEEPFLGAKTIEADVAIEFTAPNLALSHMKKCLALKIPVIVGTTGWTEALPSIKEATEQHNGSILYASNFSLGVHLFFELTKKLGGTLSGEHGIGLVQKNYMDIVFSEKALDLQKGIKNLFDPNGILNPGKILK